MECPSMQRVPKPGGSSRAFNNFCMLASVGASSLTHTHTQHTHFSLSACVSVCVTGTFKWWFYVCAAQCETGEDRCVPDEGDLVLVHPGLQLQTGIFSKRRDDETEDQSDAHEHGRKNNLPNPHFTHEIHKDGLRRKQKSRQTTE